MSGYLNCRHLTALERAVASGALSRPKPWHPLLEVLWQRGLKHEADYVAHLSESGLEAVRIEGVEIDDAAITATLDAMRAGVPVIVQAALAKAGSAWPRIKAHASIGSTSRFATLRSPSIFKAIAS